MRAPIWIEKQALLALHTRSIADHGGIDGIRDEGLLDSALHRPINHFQYDGVGDIAELAAIYGVAIAKNHPFIDGNKRAAFQAAVLFLRLNGLRLRADKVEATRIAFAVAAGEVEAPAFSEWLRRNSHPDQA
jgi:death-on-curing protein